MRKSTSCYLLIIVFCGFLLRIIQANVSFFDDEVDWLVLINAVSISKNCVVLPLAGTGHGPLAVYLTKLSGLFFGKTELGYRFIIILFNTFMIWLMFLLTKAGLRNRAGLFAAFLVAINSFLIYYSREIGCDGYFLFICTAVIYFFFMAMELNKERYMYLCGISVGLALLDKLTIVFLFPGFLIYMLVDSGRRKWFKKPILYLSILTGLVLVLPYLYWLNINQWSHFKINSGYIKLFNFPLAFSLFLNFFGGRGKAASIYSFGREYMSLGMGLLLLSGVVLTVKKARNNNLLQLMHCIFWGIISISFLFFRGWVVNFNLCILPSIILAAAFLDSIWNKHRTVKILIILFFSIHLLFIPRYLKQINKAYDHHSSLSTHSRQIPSNVNLNIISSSLVPFMEEYRPTLVVTPNPEWDTIACYLGAQTGVKTLAPVALIYDSVKYCESDWQRVLIIDSDRSALLPYVEEIQNGGGDNDLIKQENLIFRVNGTRISMPVAMVFLSGQDTSTLSKDIQMKVKGDI